MAAAAAAAVGAGARVGAGCCGACDAACVPSACTVCVNNSLAERKAPLKKLVKRCSVLRAALEEKLELKRRADERQRLRAEHDERMRRVQSQLTATISSIHKSRQQLGTQRCILEARSQELRRAADQLRIQRDRWLVQTLPRQLNQNRAQEAQLLQSLSAKRRSALQQLRSIMPLRVGGAGQQFVRICGALVAESDGQLASLHAEELSAGLGNLVHFLDMAARYLGLPLLHRARGPASSACTIWMPAAFWDQRPAARGVEFPLYRVESAPVSISTPVVQPVMSASGRDPAWEGVRQGVRLLLRSVANVCAAEWSALGMVAPPQWSPCVSLAQLLHFLTRDPHSQLGASTAGIIRQATMFGPSNGSVASASAMGFSCVDGFARDEDDPDSTDIEGWDLVERPTLPPPPSQLEDVDHWTRAMFTDAR
eukprot:jgi/Chlat1/1381/Chrsp119S01793